MRLIVFDCDGTLVDNQWVIIEAMQAAFRAQGMAEPAPSAVRHIVGLALPEAVARLCDDTAPDTVALLVAAYKKAFMALRRAETIRESLYPGAREALIELESAGYLLGVATGKSRRGLQATLERYGLREHFVTLQTADDAPSKPHPEMLVRAMAEAGAEALTAAGASVVLEEFATLSAEIRRNSRKS